MNKCCNKILDKVVTYCKKGIKEHNELLSRIGFTNREKGHSQYQDVINFIMKLKKDK